MSHPRIKVAPSLDQAKRVLGSLFLALLATPAPGAPPPGHPSPSAAMQMIRPVPTNRPAAAVRVGVALDAIDANEYTYIEVDEAGLSYWIATSRIKVVRGEMVQFEEGVTMSDFYSKLLKRTFPSVMFVGNVSTTPGGR